MTTRLHVTSVLEAVWSSKSEFAFEAVSLVISILTYAPGGFLKPTH